IFHWPQFGPSPAQSLDVLGMTDTVVPADDGIWRSARIGRNNRVRRGECDKFSGTARNESAKIRNRGKLAFDVCENALFGIVARGVKSEIHPILACSRRQLCDYS